MQPSLCSAGIHDPDLLTTVSSHVTSEGVVRYLHCACGAWLVEVAPRPGVTRAVVPRSSAGAPPRSGTRPAR